MDGPHGSAPRRAAPRPLLIGLTGPIGCGKSTVARMLGELGGTVIDADVLARRATEPGRPTLPAIRERFGDDGVRRRRARSTAPRWQRSSSRTSPRCATWRRSSIPRFGVWSKRSCGRPRPPKRHS